MVVAVKGVHLPYLLVQLPYHRNMHYYFLVDYEWVRTLKRADEKSHTKRECKNESRRRNKAADLGSARVLKVPPVK
jgi:hypothetical protein